MKTAVNINDTFLCPSCYDGMCDDCRSFTQEYMHLANARGIELSNVNETLAHQRRRIQELERQVELWKDTATIGYADIVQAFLASEVQKGFRKGRREMRAQLASIQKRAKELGSKP